MKKKGPWLLRVYIMTLNEALNFCGGMLGRGNKK